MTLAAMVALGMGVALRYVGHLLGFRFHPVALKGFLLGFLALAVEIGGVLLRVPVQGAVYALVALWGVLNRKEGAVYPLTLGATLNAVAIFLHGGMPVDPIALEKAGLAHTAERLNDGLHYLGEAFPLGDWIALPGRVLSPGDLLILLSLFLIGMKGVRA
ncbi:DUF5317 family protein [Thermus caldilimi]|uniref:DUF5317 family protein n=1 Tax=Thermus caldilimi TaxID=2483360 RepID=UPI0035709E74